MDAKVLVEKTNGKKSITGGLIVLGLGLVEELGLEVSQLPDGIKGVLDTANVGGWSLLIYGIIDKFRRLMVEVKTVTSSIEKIKKDVEDIKAKTGVINGNQ